MNFKLWRLETSLSHCTCGFAQILQTICVSFLPQRKVKRSHQLNSKVNTCSYFLPLGMMTKEIETEQKLTGHSSPYVTPRGRRYPSQHCWMTVNILQRPIILEGKCPPPGAVHLSLKPSPLGRLVGKNWFQRASGETEAWGGGSDISSGWENYSWGQDLALNFSSSVVPHSPNSTEPSQSLTDSQKIN